jgi:hypothetical protein
MWNYKTVHGYIPLFKRGVKRVHTIQNLQTWNYTCVHTWIFISAHVGLHLCWHLVLYFCIGGSTFLHNCEIKLCPRGLIFYSRQDLHPCARRTTCVSKLGFTFLQTWVDQCNSMLIYIFLNVGLHICVHVDIIFHTLNYMGAHVDSYFCKRSFTSVCTREFTSTLGN